jgi:C4-dicarboxylate transporter DctM subunit
MTSFLLIAVFFVLLILNVPIAVSLALSSIVALISGGYNFSMIPTNVYAATSKFALLAVPYFIFAGNIMEKTGISEKLIRFAQSFVGHVRGGLALVCIIVSCFFAAISGSGPATVAALGLVVIPSMIAHGYKRDYSCGLMATAGSIGVIIPPSITFVIFGCITGVSIGKLFIAGILPGILMGALLGAAAIMGIRGNPAVKKLPKASGRERWNSFKDAFWGLMMPVIILGGIYGGVFTPTESAAVSAIYGLFVGFFIYKSIKLKDLYSILVNSLSQTATVMFIMATAGLFSWVMTVEGLADRAGALMVTLSFGNKYLFLLLLNIVLLIAGCLLDGASALYILTPIFYSVALNLGIDPIHLGVVAIVNLAIGMITPPVGVDLFVACGIGNISIKEIVRGNMPFLIASLIALLLITYVPVISTFLPNLMK